MVDEVEQALIGEVNVLEDHRHRVGIGQPLEERSPGREQALRVDARFEAEQRKQGTLDHGPLVCVGNVLGDGWRPDVSRVVASSSDSCSPARSRTISPSAQKVIPSP